MSFDRTQIVKFAYIGQGGSLSIIPLKKLCDEGFFPTAVIIADPSPMIKGPNLLPVRPPLLAGSLASLAAEQDLNVIYWQRGCETDIEAKLVDLAPDLLIMSCFPWRISEPMLQIPALGWWNLHPSLLPAYRGPTPLFWQARAGEMQTGISLHQVQASLDSGDILAQQAVSMLGFTGPELEVELAQRGGELMRQALSDLQQAKLQPRPQQAAEASYQGFPCRNDTRIATIGLASIAYEFIRLTYSTHPLWFELEEQVFMVGAPVSVDDQALLGMPYRQIEDQLQVQFEYGVLTVKIKGR